MKPAATGSELWTQIAIRDPANLSGRSTASFLRGLLQISEASWVYVAGLEGAYSGFKNHENVVIDSNKALQLVSQATQYDWGLIFLYYQIPNVLPDVSDLEASISSADHTLYLVDDEYFFVYTRSDVVVKGLMRSYPEGERAEGELSILSIPY